MVPANTTTASDRRQAKRVVVHLPLQVRFAMRERGVEHCFAAELVDAGIDGCGAALVLSHDSHVPVGTTIALVVEGRPDIFGIVVSRLGMQARFRIGVRVDLASQADLRDVVVGVDGAPSV